MRILYHHRTRADDGQAVHIRSLQRGFRALGHEVREVGLVAQGEEPAPGGAPAGDARDRWGWVQRLPRFALELAEFGYSGIARRRILATGRDFRPDVVYERYAFGNAGGLLAARRLGVPFVLEVNSPLVDELARTRGLTLRRMARRIERGVWRGADRVCVVTRVLGDLLVEAGVDPARVLVTPNGVHPELFRYAATPGGRAAVRAAARRRFGLPTEPAEGELVLGFVGYFRDWHRLDLVVDLLARPGLEGLRFVVVGEGPAGPGLRARAAELGVAGRVHFTGPVAHDEVPGLLPGFDVALMPAINPYASALKLHEYMAAGLPILAPNQPNLREVVAHGESALLLPPGDAETLEAAVRCLVEEPDLRATLGSGAARAVVDLDLTWTGNARRVLAALEEPA